MLTTLLFFLAYFLCGLLVSFIYIFFIENPYTPLRHLDDVDFALLVMFWPFVLPVKTFVWLVGVAISAIYSLQTWRIERNEIRHRKR